MRTVLVVEDDERIRLLLKRVLQSAGYEVQEASNGKEALTLWNSRSVDLVITDIVMPDKDGLELITELRTRESYVKVIAMSDDGQMKAQDYLRLAKLLGADYCVLKPFSLGEILETVWLAFQAYQSPSIHLDNAPASSTGYSLGSQRI